MLSNVLLFNESALMNIEIDSRSGFCHGVTTAIKKAETELQGKERLYCLGDIVHNDREVERLRLAGLATIEHNSFSQLHDAKVLLRAHGEPPATYALAAQNRITLVDATCPVVLQLQKRVKNVYAQMPDAQIVIFGKRGHAEVIGLVGQTEGHALVIQSVEEAARLDFNRDIYLFSQTTMSLDGFHQVIDYITTHILEPAHFHYADTICRQVANRLPNIRSFAARHDVIIFVSGLKSSNGKMLYNACLQVNPRSYIVDNPAAIEREWFTNAETVGICGATSTPTWLMESCKEVISKF